jgi:hypothetical protein
VNPENEVKTAMYVYRERAAIPAFLIELAGDAPVPPSCPDIWIVSA